MADPSGVAHCATWPGRPSASGSENFHKAVGTAGQAPAGAISQSLVKLSAALNGPRRTGEPRGHAAKASRRLSLIFFGKSWWVSVRRINNKLKVFARFFFG